MTGVGHFLLLGTGTPTCPCPQSIFLAGDVDWDVVEGCEALLSL